MWENLIKSTIDQCEGRLTPEEKYALGIVLPYYDKIVNLKRGEVSEYARSKDILPSTFLRGISVLRELGLFGNYRS